ncbi:hypothetical protein GGI13_006835 [Coemansia sp. RSA 455]|nr:hypothetical protein GGI13_006835 [Coemansia sp. RSA 455]
MPLPPDAKDAFASIPITKLKSLATGYQLIGKACPLDKKGYDLALDAYKNKLKHCLDFTTCYLGSNVYDMTNKDGTFSYWSNLQSTAAKEAKHMQPGQMLFGIGQVNYWLLNIMLHAEKLKIVYSCINENKHFMLIDDPELLAIAAKRAGTTLEEALGFYQHQLADMHQRAYRSLTYKCNCEDCDENAIKWVKMAHARQCMLGDVNCDMNDNANGDVSNEAIDDLASDYARYLEGGNWNIDTNDF